MRYLSVCSGIEAATVAWKPLGWEAIAFSEIEPFPCDLLAHHYPTVPNLGDMTKFKEWPDANLDVLVGGTPCQAFSVAGLRKGLADPRGNLTLTYLAIAARFRPRWLVWENVPGVFSDDTGAFGAFLGGLAELGYMGGYRVLDAQFWGVAQRRRRPFVVGHLGDWRRAAAVLFELESLCGNPAPSREAGEGATYSTSPSLTSSGQGVERAGESRGQDCVIPIANTLQKHHGNPQLDQTLIAHTLRANSFNAGEDVTGRGIPLVSMCLNAGGMGRVDAETETETMIPVAFSSKDHGADAANDCAPTLRAMGHSGSHANAGGQVAVAIFDERQITSPDNRQSCDPERAVPTMHEKPFTVAFNARQDQDSWEERTGPLDVDGCTQAVALRGREGGSTAELSAVPSALRASQGGGDKPHVLTALQVRRLTPVECERLMGFPDNYTLIPRKGGKLAADGPRYKALGNSFAVPVMAWIGKRIAEVDAIPSQDIAP